MSSRKCDIMKVNNVKLLYFCYPIRHTVTKASALEYGLTFPVIHHALFQRDGPVIFRLVHGLKFASLEANLGGGWGLLVYPILLFYLPLSGRSPNMTEILFTGSLSLNSFNQSKSGK